MFSFKLNIDLIALGIKVFEIAPNLCHPTLINSRMLEPLRVSYLLKIYLIYIYNLVQVRDTTNRSIASKAVQDECAALYNVSISNLAYYS